MELKKNEYICGTQQKKIMKNITKKKDKKIFEHKKRFDTKIFDQLAELQKLKEDNRKSTNNKELRDKIEFDLNLKVKNLMEKNNFFGIGFFSDGHNTDEYILTEKIA